MKRDGRPAVDAECAVGEPSPRDREAKPAHNIEGYRRDACSTRKRKATGGTPAPLADKEEPEYMRFCETNPPAKKRIMNGLGDLGCEFGCSDNAPASAYQALLQWSYELVRAATRGL